MHIISLEEAKAYSAMSQHGVIDSDKPTSREAATETEHQMLLPSLRGCLCESFVFRGHAPAATCCRRFAVTSAQLQNSRVAIRSSIASRKIGAAGDRHLKSNSMASTTHFEEIIRSVVYPVHCAVSI